MRPWNSGGFDSPVSSAKFSPYPGIAKGGQVGMGVGVILYGVSLPVLPFHQTRIQSGLFTDDEEGRFDPVVSKDVQDSARVAANWPVVEGEFNDPGCSLCCRSELLRLS